MEIIMAIKEISDEGLKELIKTEGVRYQVYDDRTGKPVSSYSDVRGYPTIGVGHLIKDRERSYFSKYLKGRSSLSKSQVFKLLRQDVPKYTDPLLKKIEKPITQSMLDALVSLAYNTGPNSRSVKNSIARINQKDYKGAAQAILDGPTTSKGRTLKGLVKRRKAEYEWFLKDGEPGSLLQRMFFWTGITAATVALGVTVKNIILK